MFVGLGSDPEVTVRENIGNFYDISKQNTVKNMKFEVKF